MTLKPSMTLDKDLYRRAYEQHRRWNEAELADRARNAGKLSPAEAWKQYLALVEFCWKLYPQQSEWQREQKLADLAQYHERVKRLEAWRRARGKTTCSSPQGGRFSARTWLSLCHRRRHCSAAVGRCPSHLRR